MNTFNLLANSYLRPRNREFHTQVHLVFTVVRRLRRPYAPEINKKTRQKKKRKEKVGKGRHALKGLDEFTFILKGP